MNFIESAKQAAELTRQRLLQAEHARHQAMVNAINEVFGETQEASTWQAKNMIDDNDTNTQA